jgi:hypothetical protein
LRRALRFIRRNPFAPRGRAMPPRKIIILRHGEKQNPFQLCALGVRRSLALTTKYLGKGAKSSLFAANESPAAFLAITLHTLELASPSAQTWGLPVTLYSAVPISDSPLDSSPELLNARTKLAAHHVMTNPAWHRKTIVMVWEHKRIASEELETTFKREKVTLRALLNLDKLGAKAVPKTWHGDNYDYFWVVTYDKPGSPNPTGIRKIKQKFGADYRDLPSNNWGKTQAFPPGSGCES